jgi:glutaminase
MTDLSSVPARSPIDFYLKELHTRHQSFREGRVADYIPELAKANPDWFGICIATRDGHVYEVGDTRQRFTIQSVSKAITYGLALEDRGEDLVLSRISVEPSGDAFNAISLKADSGAPFNPMINAGAIATCGQVLPKDGMTRIDRILAYLSACAGRKLDIDTAVYRSESETGHRNRAIGWMLRNFGIIDEEPTDILETYFQQCAIRVTCRDLALIGATLANNGRNPLTLEQAIVPEFVDNILSVMSTCGMYDYSGEWLYRVGLPAKSGVGGGVLAVLPGQLGIGIFSPPLDMQGNSARGIKVCADLSRDLALHLFAPGATPVSVMRLSYDGGHVASRRHRAKKLHDLLRGKGHRIRLLELQGQLNFSTFESVVRFVLKQAPYCHYLVFNMRHVANIDKVALGLILDLQNRLADTGVELVICNAGLFADDMIRQGIAPKALFVDDDAALEYCENGLLSGLVGAAELRGSPVGLADTFLLSGMDAAALTWLDSQMPERSANVGEHVIRVGETGDSLYLLMSGSVGVYLPSPTGGKPKRLEVFEAGRSFGEMSFLDGSERSADVVAMEPIIYRVIDRSIFERLGAERPDVKLRLFEQLCRQLSTNLRKANIEISAFRE